MSFGAMGGDGQQQAVTAPRWRLDPTPLSPVGAFDGRMGHAGALVRHENGVIEGAADPRSDGSVAGF
jgi:gamma-glutamyltranspeptidase